MSTALEPIEIDIEFNGATDASSATQALATAIAQLSGKIGELGQKSTVAEDKVKKLKTEEEKAAEAAQALSTQQTAASTRAIAFAQRIAGVSNAVQSLTSHLGSRNQTAGLVGSVVGATAQFAQMGAVFGPQGALIGGILGAVGAIGQLINQHHDATQAAREHAEAIDRMVSSLQEFNQREGMRDAIRTATANRGDAHMILSGYSDDQISAEHQRTIAERQSILTSQDGLNPREIRDAVRRLNELRQNIEMLEGELSTRGEEAGAADDQAAARRRSQMVQRETALQEREERRHEHSGPSRAEIESENIAAFLEREREGYAAIADEIERRKALGDEMREQSHQSHLEEMEEQRAKMDATREQLTIEEEAASERRRLAREYTDALIEANRRAHDVHQQQVEEYQQVTGVIVGGLTDALASIIAGQKSAGDAFKGLLAAFLKYISEMAALKAAAEYAEAIADFASENYSGGAQHLAAGVAFTAVAVAAGAGAAALSAPSKSGPEEGRSSRDKDDGKGGDVVINWNAPVYTSSQRAEMGRELGGLLSDASARYG